MGVDEVQAVACAATPAGGTAKFYAATALYAFTTSGLFKVTGSPCPEKIRQLSPIFVNGDILNAICKMTQ